MHTDAIDNGVGPSEVNVLDPQSVEAALLEAKPSEVFHCAGIASVSGSWDNIVDTLATNVRGTKHLLDGLRQIQVCARILVPGSALVYRPKHGALTETDPLGPVNPYGLSKLAQEMLAVQRNSKNQQVMLTRSFTHIGARQNLAYATSSFAHQIARIEYGQTDSTVRVGILDTHRDVLDVRDTVSAYQALMRHGTPGKIYNVCAGRTYQMREILSRLISLARVPIKIRVDEDRVRPNDYPDLRGDPTAITTDVGWKPKIELDQTLREILNYWRTQCSNCTPVR